MRHTRRIQLLWCTVEIETDDENVHTQLAYMDHGARQSVESTRTLRLAARRDGDAYALDVDGAPAGHAESPREVLLEFFRAAYLAAFASLPDDAILIHGVTVGVGDDRLLLVGPSGVGKSTLAAHLTDSGHEVLGDEYAVLVDGVLTALPRRFHLKEGSFEQLPELATILEASPLVTDDLGRWARSFDPADIGRPRRIEAGPLRAVVELEANHGGATTLEPMSQIDIAMRLMAQTFRPDGPGGEWIARLCAALRDASSHRLVLGDVREGLVALAPLLG